MREKEATQSRSEPAASRRMSGRGFGFGTKESNSWCAPLAQKGSALWALFWAPYGLFFHWGPGLGATWRGQDFRPSLFFSPSPRVAVRRFPPSLSSRPEMMARLPARLPLERRAQGPVICAGARAAPGRLRKLIDAKAKVFFIYQ